MGRFTIKSLWRKGSGTPESPNNGRLIWRVLGIHPSRWRRYRYAPPDIQPTLMTYLRTLWQELSRYELETCMQCGRRVGSTGTWWLADNSLWQEVMGHLGGVLCQRCFTEACDRRGITIYWKPIVDRRVQSPISKEDWPTDDLWISI